MDIVSCKLFLLFKSLPPHFLLFLLCFALFYPSLVSSSSLSGLLAFTSALLSLHVTQSGVAWLDPRLSMDWVSFRFFLSLNTAKHLVESLFYSTEMIQFVIMFVLLLLQLDNIAPNLLSSFFLFACVFRIFYCRKKETVYMFSRPASRNQSRVHKSRSLCSVTSVIHTSRPAPPAYHLPPVWSVLAAGHEKNCCRVIDWQKQPFFFLSF